MKKQPLPYTARELREFDKLSLLCSSRIQMRRILGRLEMLKFIRDHGEKKCDAMWQEIQKREKAKK